MSKIKIGDRVMWRGGFGTLAPCEATITGLQRTSPGEKYGDEVREVEHGESYVADLSNGKWAYGHQITPIK